MKMKDVARVARSFKIEVGGFRAQGAPAVILALSGLTLAVGVVRMIAQNAGVLPETLREAKGLVDSLRSDESVRRLAS